MTEEEIKKIIEENENLKKENEELKENKVLIEIKKEYEEKISTLEKEKNEEIETLKKESEEKRIADIKAILSGKRDIEKIENHEEEKSDFEIMVENTKKIINL